MEDIKKKKKYNYLICKPKKSLSIQLQADSTKLSDAVDIWLDVIENKDLECYQKFFKKRFSEAIKPFHYLAYMLDPKKIGKSFKTESKEFQ